ncbi:ArgP/LysG family DNA-binding transcriptional regulator [Corynebacterium glyciniphilum]|uniref:ArgP/LysG family DNA-binding transcriptional regulator n=1 Tax=Corynebacterium glyciniphilum TaxID=1404244 RepID=UPI0026500013|nr:ArgP/LysG family DNA-binding transcriptional regulator [Corynebacterium glyciniphilum]MDN6705710.1 ArgP/LysG family DNA-binding transcriptional regulator [Corynebacterium glyciniphilum]
MMPRHMDTLLLVVDEGSFEAAADRLGVSPSAVSQRIKALEADVGRVVVRRTSPVGVTDAGEVLVQTARRMRLLESETDDRLRGRIGERPVSVGVNADSLGTWFRPVLRQVAEVGGISLELNLEDEQHSLAMLRRGDCMGVVTAEAEPVAGCVVEELGSLHYWPVGAPDLAVELEAARTVRGEDAWASLPLLVIGPHDRMTDGVLEPRGVTPRPGRRVSRIPSFEGLNDAVVAGLGWTLVPVASAQPYVDAGTMVRLAEDVIEVPLYWQHWRLESDTLGVLTDAVHAAAAVGLSA